MSSRNGHRMVADGDRPAEPLRHEELVVRRGPRTGLYVIVAPLSLTWNAPGVADGARLRTFSSPWEEA